MPTHDPTPHEDAREERARRRELAYRHECAWPPSTFEVQPPTAPPRVVFTQREPIARPSAFLDCEVSVRFNCVEAYRAFVERAARHPIDILEEFARAVGVPLDELELAAAREFFDSMGVPAAERPTS